MRTSAGVAAETLEMASWVHSLAPWSVIAHHTFVWSASIWSAQKSFERFMHRTIPDVSYFYAVEQNPSRDGHHVHALWADCDEVFRRDVWSKWFDRYGRSRIEPCRSRADVAGYCSKYVTKETAWWNFRLSADRWFQFQQKGVVAAHAHS